MQQKLKPIILLLAIFSAPIASATTLGLTSEAGTTFDSKSADEFTADGAHWTASVNTGADYSYQSSTGLSRFSQDNGLPILENTSSLFKSGGTTATDAMNASASSNLNYSFRLDRDISKSFSTTGQWVSMDYLIEILVQKDSIDSMTDWNIGTLAFILLQGGDDYFYTSQSYSDSSTASEAGSTGVQDDTYKFLMDYDTDYTVTLYSSNYIALYDYHTNQLSSYTDAFAYSYVDPKFTVDAGQLDFGKSTLNVSDFSDIEKYSTAVPEPSAIALMGLGLLGFGVTRRKQKKN